MNAEQAKVAAFHQAFAIHSEATPRLPDAATRALRLSLIREEADELAAALAKDDLVETADALADLLYVVYGTALACGIDMTPVFDEVHRSNMTKVGGHKRADGKWVKPAHYSPARIAPLLRVQGAAAADATDRV